MKSKSSNLSRPQRSEEAFAARPFDTLDTMKKAVEHEGNYWGFYTTTSKARIGLRAGRDWREVLEEPRLVEVRLFNDSCDLYWLEGRGLWLRPLATAEPATDTEVVGGPGWLERSRASRLWGEWLSENRWYEERIPRPIEVQGIEGHPKHRYIFLHYHEYIRRGQVEFIRYEGVKGAEA